MNNNSNTNNNTIIPGSNLQPIMENTTSNNNVNNGQIIPNQVQAIMPNDNNFTLNTAPNIIQPTTPNNNIENNQVSPIMQINNNNLVGQEEVVPSILPNDNVVGSTINNLGDSSPLSSESENYIDDDDNFVSVKTYLINFILLSIPVVGFILILIKAFNKKENRNIKNFARALILYSLIIMIIMSVIIFISYMYLPMLINGRL